MNKIKEYGLENKNGIVVLSSRVIAKELGKEHSKVLLVLDKIFEKPDSASLIIPSTYKVEGQNKSYKEYLLTKNGFLLYMFSIQGYEEFKLDYINKFDEMEKIISEQKSNISLEDQLLLRIIKADNKEESSKALSDYHELIVKPLKIKNKEMEPKAETYDSYLSADGSITATNVAKILGFKSANELNKKLIELKIQHKVSSDNSYVLNSKYEDKGYTKYIVRTIDKINDNDEVEQKNVTQMRWLSKGIEFLKNKLNIGDTNGNID